MDETCTWRMDRRRPDARTTLDTCALGGRATVPAHQRRQPPRSLPNDADRRAGRPPPPRYMGLIAGHLVPGPSSVSARSHRCHTHYTPTALRCALPRPFPANPLLQAVPPTWISMTPCGRSPPSLFVNMSRVYSVNAVNQLTGLFPHG